MDYLARARENRPDALGYWQDSQARESKYADAMRRVVAALEARARPVDPADVRGKRRARKKPQDASHTINTYLKALETFSYWMQITYGHELDPANVTREVCFRFVDWMSNSSGPSIRGLRVQAGGEAMYSVFQAADRASSIYGWADIRQIYEHLSPRYSAEYAPGEDGDFQKLHKVMGQLVRQYRAVKRSPTSKEIRRRMGVIWTAVEQNPLTYKYTVPVRTAYAPSSICTWVSALSAIWDALTEGENTPGGEAPLKYNPWKGPRGPYAIVRAKLREYQRREESKPMISHSIVDAMLEAASGTDLEARRNKAALLTLLYTGVRAEEVVGMLRKDLISVDGVLSVRVIGKGDKVRTIPLYSEVRDAYAQLDAVLEGESRKDSSDPEEQYRAAYATALLQSRSAPIIPSLPRWGANERDIPADEAALEPLDTSGLRAILCKLADRARVFDKKKRIVRPLNDGELERIHPHALRHYAATAAQEAGLAMEEVKRLLGHEDLRTTERYVHIEARAVAQFGAYIAKSRSGAVMTPEEADRLERARGSALEDPNIVAAPSEEQTQRTTPTKPRPEQESAAAPERRAEIVDSPTWAYQSGSERLNLYLPRGLTAETVPKGQGFALTFRIGSVSNLPWWAGRANRWKGEQMAPIISFYQAFAERSNVNIQSAVVEAFYTVLEERGVTSASAFAEWVREIVGVASTGFFSIMVNRGDAWMDFEQPALAGQDGIVRMHDNAKILEWFRKNADRAEASVLRARPEWEAWRGNISEPIDVRAVQETPPLFETRFRVERIPGFGDFFAPTRTEEGEVRTYRGGTGKGLRRIRFRPPSRGKAVPWSHAVIVDTEGDEVVILGDPLPEILGRFEVSTEGKRTLQERYHPVLAAMEDLPDWFFASDPLLDLPFEERKAMRDWVEKLQGTKISKKRLVSSAHMLANILQSWWDSVRELNKMVESGSASQEAIRDRADQVRSSEVAIKEASIEQFGVEIDPRVIAGRAGQKWEGRTRKEHAQILGLDRPRVIVDEEAIEKQADDVEKRMEMKLPPLERRIFAFIELATGKPYDMKDIHVEAIIRESEGLFGSDNVRWNDEEVIEAVRLARVAGASNEDVQAIVEGMSNTIVHTKAYKERFYRARGTSSECVARRALRALWERKKEHDAKFAEKAGDIIATHWPAPRIHHDIIMRHMGSLMAYLIPCPEQMEKDLMRLFEEAVRAKDYSLLPLPFREIVPVGSEPPPILSDEILPGQLRQWWFDMVTASPEPGIAARFRPARTETERRAEEVKAAFEEAGEGFAKKNPGINSIIRAMPNPIMMVMAELWPV